jgi:hypothetical protein
VFADEPLYRTPVSTQAHHRCLRSLVSRPYGQVSKPDRPNFAAQGIPGNNRAVMVRTPRYKFTRYIDGGEELDDLQA